MSNDNENLFKKTYNKENEARTLAEQNSNANTDNVEDAPPADSAIKKAQAGQQTVIPDQSGRNSQLSDAEDLEYKAVHNDTSAPDYRDEIYKEKPVNGTVANQ